MQDTYVTFHGWVGNDVRHRVVRETSIASFRVGVTPRIRKEGEWVDGETAWYSVTAWRSLADHVRRSVRKGDPVIVHGRLRTETWAPEGGAPSTNLLVDATLVGHDLNRGFSHFWKERPLESGVTDVDGTYGQASGPGPEATPAGERATTPAEGQDDGQPGGSAAA
jgi:single-strand DNA-binding protein